MKRDKYLALPISVALGFCIAFAGVMCVQSAFTLEANLLHVMLGCMIAAVLFSLGFTLKWWYVSLVPVLAAAGWFWYQGQLGQSIECLVYRISVVYNSAYDCGVMYWGGKLPETGDVTLALSLAGCLVAFVCAWVICRRKPAIFAVLPAVLPLAACFVVTDTVPASGYLFLLLFGITVLLLTQLTRRKDIKKGNLLTALVAVPTALAVAILFWAIPKDTYRGQERANRIMETVQSWVEELGEQGPAGTSTAVQQTVELDKKGRLVQTHTPVMTVNAFPNGKLYLRQQGFQMYDGTSWYNEWGIDIYKEMQWEHLEYSGEVTISTRDTHRMKFTPYYAQDASVNPYGVVVNTNGEYTYYFSAMRLAEDAPSTEYVDLGNGYIYWPNITTTTTSGGVSMDAIALPGSTVEWAESVAYPLVEGKTTVKEWAEAIGAYVRSLAPYDRNTARMPAGETDFARWFATEADSGYCVHYATTAAVLLRAVGIHAQYVEGYVCQAQAGTAVTVYEDQAHAWVEYYDPAVGWRILEATPAEGVPTYIRGPQGQTQNSPQEPVTPPQQNTPQQQPQQELPRLVWSGWYWIAGVLAAVLAVVLQWQLRLRCMRRRLARGTVNQQAVQLWREWARLSKWCKRRPKPELFALAQKAKFSNHELTIEELGQLQAALEECRKALKAKAWYLQPIYTILLAIY